MKTKKWG